MGQRPYGSACSFLRALENLAERQDPSPPPLSRKGRGELRQGLSPARGEGSCARASLPHGVTRVIFGPLCFVAFAR